MNCWFLLENWKCWHRWPCVSAAAAMARGSDGFPLRQGTSLQTVLHHPYPAPLTELLSCSPVLGLELENLIKVTSSFSSSFLFFNYSSMAGQWLNLWFWHIFNSLQALDKKGTGSFAENPHRREPKSAYGNLTYNSEPNCIRWGGLGSLFSVPRVNELPSRTSLCEYQMSILWKANPGKVNLRKRKGLHSKGGRRHVASPLRS